MHSKRGGPKNIERVCANVQLAHHPPTLHSTLPLRQWESGHDPNRWHHASHYFSTRRGVFTAPLNAIYLVSLQVGLYTDPFALSTGIIELQVLHRGQFVAARTALSAAGCRKDPGRPYLVMASLYQECRLRVGDTLSFRIVRWGPPVVMEMEPNYTFLTLRLVSLRPAKPLPSSKVYLRRAAEAYVIQRRAAVSRAGTFPSWRTRLRFLFNGKRQGNIRSSDV